MDSILKADIFFFITTLCVVSLTVLLALVLWHILRIVSIVSKMFDIVQGEVEGLADDIQGLRAYVRKNQFGLKPIFDAIQKKAKSFERKKTRKKKEKSDISETFQ